MPITVFRNMGGGRLEPLAVPGLDSTDGWWNRIVAGDFTGDGRVDFIVGNLGENGRLHATKREPVTMVAKDFDRNDAYEQILSIYDGGVSRPLPLRDDLLRTLPMLAPRFPTYASYAGKTVDQIFTKEELADAVVKSRPHLRDDARAQRRRRQVHPRPASGRGAARAGVRHPRRPTSIGTDTPTCCSPATSTDSSRRSGGWRRASGCSSAATGAAASLRVRATESGFFVPGQSRDIARVRTAAGDAYLVARNNDRADAVPRRGDPSRVGGA